MNKLLAFLALVSLLVGIPVESYALQQFPLNVEKRLNLGDVRGPGVLLGYQVISLKEQLLKCTYDFSVQGGSTAAAISLNGVDGAPCKLPAKALIVSSLIDVITAPTSTGSATIAIGSGQAANDLKAALAYGSWSGRIDGIPVRTAATAVKLTAAQTPTATIAVAPLTAGKFNVFIQYLLSN